MKSSTTIMLACLFASTATAAALVQPQGRSVSLKNQVDRDRITCRRFVRTGSLAGSYRSCKTNREWQREHQNIQNLDVLDSCRNRGTGGEC